MRSDFKLKVSLKKLAYNLLVAAIPLTIAWLEDIQKNGVPKYGAIAAAVVVGLRWAQNAFYKPT